MVKPHVPLIHFRKAGEPLASPAAAAASQVLGAAKAEKANQVKAVSLEWWQTPDKFRKRLIDELECDIINVSTESMLATLDIFLLLKVPALKLATTRPNFSQI